MAAWLAVRYSCTHPRLPENRIHRDEPLGVYCHRVKEAGYAVLWGLPTVLLGATALLFWRNARLLIAITILLILGLVVAVALSQSLSNGNFNI